MSECKSLPLEHIETRCGSDPSSPMGHASFYSLFELVQWLSSNYYSSLFKRPVIKRTEKRQICSLPGNTAEWEHCCHLALVKFMWPFLEITINSNLFVVACALRDVEILVSYLRSAALFRYLRRRCVRYRVGFGDISRIETKSLISQTFLLGGGEIASLSDQFFSPGTLQKYFTNTLGGGNF